MKYGGEETRSLLNSLFRRSSSKMLFMCKERTCSPSTELFRANKMKCFPAFPWGPNPQWTRALSQCVCAGVTHTRSCCGVDLCVDISSRAYVHKACQTVLESCTEAALTNVAAQWGRPLGPCGFSCSTPEIGWKFERQQNRGAIKEWWAAEQQHELPIPEWLFEKMFAMHDMMNHLQRLCHTLFF